MDQRLMAEARALRITFLATLGLCVCITVTIIGQALLLSRIINQAFLHNATLADVSGLLWTLAAVVSARALLNGAKTIAAAQLAIRIKADLRERLIRHITELGPAFTQGERSGELVLAITDGIEALDAFFRDYLPALIVAGLVPLTILLAVLPLDSLTFAVLLLTGPLIPVFMILIGRAAGALARQQYGALSRMSAHFLDVVQGLPTLKLFNRSRQQIETIATITDHFRVVTMRVLRLAFLSAFVLEFLATISVAIVAVEIGLRLLAGTIAFEQALFLLVIAPEFYLPLRELGARFHAGRDGTAAADRIFAILQIPLPQTAGQLTIPESFDITFDDVAVTYGDRPALHNITFSVKSGETVALVGTSGSGKSTIAHLLLRFVTPDAGLVRIGGVDLNQLDMAEWRQRIAWVPQRPYLFNMSAAANIRIGRPDATDADVIAAARATQAHEFIMALEHGYDTILGERATRLSGGQAQRIALARAFLHDAPLLILDEATANLDTTTEHAVMQTLNQQRAGRTTLVIAHRLNTIQQADRVYVLSQGRVVQQGAPATLVAEPGPYRDLMIAFGEHPHDQV